MDVDDHRRVRVWHGHAIADRRGVDRVHAKPKHEHRKIRERRLQPAAPISSPHQPNSTLALKKTRKNQTTLFKDSDVV